MKYLVRTVFAVVLSLSAASCSDTGDYDVYLLIGQSNMAGRGTMLAEDTLNVMEGVWLLDPSGKPEPAKAPLNKYSTIRKSLEIQQICPGNTFSEEIRKATSRKVLLVENARGGTSLKEWMKANPDRNYFSEAVRRAKEAAEYGKIRAILWHQGEADRNRTGTYLDSLAVFVSDLRDALEDDNIPFIAGEIGHWTRNAEAFNEMLSHISERIPYSACVSSEGCSMLKDEADPHFSRDGQHLLGRRYAEKVLEMVKF